VVSRLLLVSPHPSPLPKGEGIYLQVHGSPGERAQPMRRLRSEGWPQSIFASALASSDKLPGKIASEGDCLLCPELKLTMLVFFGHSENLTTGHATNMLEHSGPNFVDGLGSVDDATCRKIEVARHAFEDGRV